MIKLLISGINGAMGKTMLLTVKDYDELTVVAGVDIDTSPIDGIPVYSSFSDIKENIDVVVDFSHPDTLNPLLDYCKEKSVHAVLCTTGYSPEQEEHLREVAHSIAILRSANMSLGVNLIAHLATLASKFLGDGFDVEIIEKHHRRKVDAPSGTALMLANSINEANDGKYNYVFERESLRQSRSSNELGIHSVRGGNIVGEHEIIFAGTDETVTISHSISSRTVFAVGAAKAAIFIASQTTGFYTLSDIIG